MITYKQRNTIAPDVEVYLDRKLVGVIKRVGPGAYQYFPKGHTQGGDVFKTLRECQQSLEGE